MKGFSILGGILTKYRSAANHETIEAIAFLYEKFKEEGKENDKTIHNSN